MQNRTFLVTIAIVGVLSLAAFSVRANGVSTEDFVHKASIANEFEIESSKLALEKSQNSDIKAFAQRMVDDHTKTGKDLKDVLQTSRSPSQAQDKLDSKHQKLMNKLESLSADDFNRQYIAMQTNAHKEAVNLFDEYAKHGKSEPLKEFASDTLPALKDHLNHVEKLKVDYAKHG